MSCIGARAPAVVLSKGVARASSGRPMLAAAIRRVAAPGRALMQRPAAVPSVALSFAARRGYPANVFNHPNRVATKAAVSEAEVVVEEEPVKLLTSDESEDLLKIRHTTAHICAMAVQKLLHLRTKTEDRLRWFLRRWRADVVVLKAGARPSA